MVSALLDQALHLANVDHGVILLDAIGELAADLGKALHNLLVVKLLGDKTEVRKGRGAMAKRIERNGQGKVDVGQCNYDICSHFGIQQKT